jgi:hypothetical protein
VKLKHKSVEWISRYPVAAVLTLYIVLTIIFTYPVAFSANAIPGVGGDGYWFLWDFWAFKNAIFTHTNPLLTSYIYYPIGVNLAFSTTSFFNAALSVPLQLIWDLPHAYIFVWLMSFVLSGFGMFALMRYLGGSTKVAFISGLIFMFCPYRFAHGLGHMNLIATGWIPLYALFFLKTIREDKWSNPVISGIFLTLTAFSDFYYVVYLVVFSALSLVICFWREGQPTLRARMLTRTVLPFVIFVGLALPLILAMIQEMLRGSYMYSSYKDFVGFSADLVAFVVPSVLHPLFGPTTADIYRHFLSNIVEGTVFIGFTGLLLSVFAILKIKTKEVRFWVVALAVFLVLSLGPVLQLDGIVLVPVPGVVPFVNAVPVPLPYIVLMFVPVFSIARVPARWDIMVMLCVSVLSGYAIQYLTSITRSPARLFSRQNLLCVAITGVVLFEFLSVPYPMTTTAVPAFYQQMAADPVGYAIIEVPSPAMDSQAMYYQTTHHKELVNGNVSRTPDSALRFIETEPTVHFLFHLQEYNRGNTAADLRDLDPSALSHYTIRYVIVHRDYLTQQQVYLVDALFKNASQGAPIVYEDGPMIVYAISGR